MKNIAIVTDSNSGITQSEAKRLGVYVLPMPFYINGKLFYEDINLTQEEFYAHLKEGSEISTSTPAVGDVTELWDLLLKDYDEIVHIPMSSALSSTCATAMMLAQSYEGRVFVVDNKRISVTQKQAVLDAQRLAAAGWDGLSIREKLLDTMYDCSIYITLDTLYYLKKGGRITPAVAALGTLLHIRPVLQIQGEKLDTFANARTKKSARGIMLDAIRKDCQIRFGASDHTASQKEAADPSCDSKGASRFPKDRPAENNLSTDGLIIAMAYTGAFTDEAQSWKEEIENAFPAHRGKLLMDPLSLSISCHIGPGAIGIGCIKKLRLPE
ncbi:MAG: DegV family protein [Lachnospiraceae bacterium]|nr:DegV family protein [Lachnospiraceae bacterium]